MAKVLVSLDDRLLARIDRVARTRGLTRSAYLADVAARDVRRASRPDERERRALRTLDAVFAGAQGVDSTAAVRAARDSR